MPYFSRLTDIVTCNLSDLIGKTENPAEALSEILAEMEQGIAGARRSVTTASANVERLKGEIKEQQAQVGIWMEQARKRIADGDEEAARLALMRKQEVEDVIAGLEQEQRAAEKTRVHLETTLRALEGRMNDARRKQAELSGTADAAPAASAIAATMSPEEQSRRKSVDDELAALKKELGG
ncbi:PspA/IM30 family protein [Stratiformator vulcanicus]|uniref:Phage shock protein A n=1 Tax=Stratiformator vulcanicus TaxID=2527980 RepID=A0A517R0R4_9PLAN|nr:PspA/IM30 family protein [Stratiformator vulcanicus]QDT37492.1 hypothetical protein Pan189_18720 [Stratiformator vulcanicus]